ncbi:hypothetical protein BX666DRAFT_1917358 [Dichotomocladium elegans]|nr:hypothetical protein BX666DRAFT_1917358 [Dichotomocladium elegans]
MAHYVSWCGELPIYSEVSPQPPLTLQERRTRNKAASAKYRQKKSQQQKEMKRLVCHITEQNAILDRQLQELRAENDRLRKTTDQMRGQLVARKMFRQWLLKEAEAHPSSAHSNRSAFHPAWGAGHHLVQDEVDLLYPDDSDELF